MTGSRCHSGSRCAPPAARHAANIALLFLSISFCLLRIEFWEHWEICELLKGNRPRNEAKPDKTRDKTSGQIHFCRYINNTQNIWQDEIKHIHRWFVFLSLSLCLDLSFGEGKIPLDRFVYIHNATMLTLHNYMAVNIYAYIYLYI